MSRILILLVALVLAFPALAEEYEKGPNGGLMLDVMTWGFPGPQAAGC